MPGRRTRAFGSLRQLPSGRWQARYRGPDGLLRPAPFTFPLKRDGARWLALTEAELLAGTWIDPEAGLVPFTDYAEAWLDERPGLRPKTIQLYRYLVRRHLIPGFGAYTLAGITDADVRRWRADALAAGASEITTAKAYRLLKSILATAIDDGLIRRNPCRLRGAGTEHSPERPLLTIAQVYELAAACGPIYRVMILLACFCGLRWGELAALRRRDIDTDSATVRITRQLTEVTGRPPFFGPPKTLAGRRVVFIPDNVLPEVQDHLDAHTASGPDALMFTSTGGKPLRHSTFRRGTWYPALAATGLTGTHFHDLRHAGNHLVAEAGANLRELMERMGHSSSRAALIYLHSSPDRQRALAAAIAARTRQDLNRKESGTRVARNGQADATPDQPANERGPPELPI
jgi:integrase